MQGEPLDPVWRGRVRNNVGVAFIGSVPFDVGKGTEYKLLKKGGNGKGSKRHCKPLDRLYMYIPSVMYMARTRSDRKRRTTKVHVGSVYTLLVDTVLNGPLLTPEAALGQKEVK